MATRKRTIYLKPSEMVERKKMGMGKNQTTSRSTDNRNDRHRRRLDEILGGGLQNVKEIINSFVQNMERLQKRTNEDYIGDDGLLYCGVCHTRKQCRVNLLDEDRIMPIVCDCRKKELARQEEEAKREREMMKIERLRSLSLLSKSFESASFETYAQNESNAAAYRIGRNYVKKFSEMYESGQGLLFYGSVGTGKSWTAACIANALLNRGVSVVMTSLNEILKMISDGAKNEETILQTLNKARLLILDDLGTERSTSFALEKVYNVIDGRVRTGKPMILTTNLTLSEITAPQDIAYKRIYDRVVGVCYPVQIAGSSFRMADAKKRIQAVRALLDEDDE